jgi:hypothetical protein
MSKFVLLLAKNRKNESSFELGYKRRKRVKRNKKKYFSQEVNLTLKTKRFLFFYDNFVLEKLFQTQKSKYEYSFGLFE